MVSGEYVVLDAAVALVMAVDARAVVRWVSRGAEGSAQQRLEPVPPEVAMTRKLAERAAGVDFAEALSLDVTALRRGARKLGLGSSAAAAAATAGAIWLRAGRAITTVSERRVLLELALEGHRAVAPEGSGADVAASVLGGLVRFRRDPESGAVLEATPAAFPKGTELRVVWTGKEARTSELVRHVRALRESEPRSYERVMGALREAAEQFVEAVSAGDASALVRATALHHSAMANLGAAAGVSIVDPTLARAAELARAHGGAAKPSGAGGGDVALAFFTDASAAERFAVECPQHGLELVSVAVGAEGVRPEV